jgi:hypothetical protein
MCAPFAHVPPTWVNQRHIVGFGAHFPAQETSYIGANAFSCVTDVSKWATHITRCVKLNNCPVSKYVYMAFQINVSQVVSRVRYLSLPNTVGIQTSIMCVYRMIEFPAEDSRPCMVVCLAKTKERLSSWQGCLHVKDPKSLALLWRCSHR